MIAIRAMASSRAGSASSMSIGRMSTVSTQPPEVPGEQPERHADEQRQQHRADGDAQRHAVGVEHALSTSRPSASEPNGCARLGAPRMRSVSIASGSCGREHRSEQPDQDEDHDDRRAPQRRGVTPRNASRPVPGRHGNAAHSSYALSLLDAGVEQSVEQVGHEVHEDEERGDHEDAALHDRVVALADGGHDEPADPRQAEQRLDHDRPAEEHAELDADHGDDRGARRCAARAGRRSCARHALRPQEGTYGCRASPPWRRAWSAGCTRSRRTPAS